MLLSNPQNNIRIKRVINTKFIGQMQQSKNLIVIPSRLSSTRLPEKPLADINGKPMILRVYERAIRSKIADVVVATDSEKIAEVVEKIGGRCVMTSQSHNSGTDRIWEALNKLEHNLSYENIVNLQGDMPFIDSESIQDCFNGLADGEFDITTLACEIENPSDAQDANIVKPVIANLNDIDKGFARALYFSRAQVPHNSEKFYYHIGIYGFKKPALKKFVELPQSFLEKTEKLEQLRALENGMKIGIKIVSTTPISVDTPNDLAKAIEYAKANKI